MEDKFEELKRKVLEKVNAGKPRRPPETRDKIIDVVFELLSTNKKLKDGVDKIKIREIDIIRETWGQNLSKDKIKLKTKQLSEYLVRINNAVHGDKPSVLVNEDIPLYLKKSGNFLILFLNIEEIRLERAIYFNKRGKNKIDKYWAEGVHFNYDKYDNNKPIINIRFEEIDYSKVSDALQDAIKVNSVKNKEIDSKEVASPINEKTKKNINNWKADPNPNSWVPYPGPTFGVKEINFTDIYRSKRVEFVLYPTNYFKFLAAQEWYKKFIKKYSSLDVHKPIVEISHSISPVGFLIVKDGNDKYAIFAKRTSSNKLGTGQGIMGLPICVTLRREPFPDERKILDEGFKLKGLENKDIKELIEHDSDKKRPLFIEALIRGAKTELGIENIDENNIKILAYGLDMQRYLYSVIAIVEIDFQKDEVEIRSQQSEFGKIQYDDGKKRALKPILYNSKTIADFLRNLKTSERCPTTMMAAYYACLHSFGSEEVAKHFGDLIG
jgi:hypothetical protein